MKFRAAVVVAALVGACNRRGDSSGCVPGAALPCACVDGRQGAQVCKADHTFALCECTSSQVSADSKPPVPAPADEVPPAPQALRTPARVAPRAPTVDARAPGADASEPHGTIDRERVNALLAERDRSFRMCYQRSLAEHPALAGRMEVRFTVGMSSRVTAATTSGLDEAPDVGRCVAQIVRSIVFPPPAGAPVDLVYPLDFAPPSPAPSPVQPTTSRFGNDGCEIGAARACTCSNNTVGVQVCLRGPQGSTWTTCQDGNGVFCE